MYFLWLLSSAEPRVASIQCHSFGAEAALSGTVTPFSNMSKLGRKTKRKLQTSSPPNRKAKGGKSSEADCLICEEPILEADVHCMHW